MKGEVFKAILKAHLDPYIGFLHTTQVIKPSLVCDIQEMFRIYVEEFVLEFVKTLDKNSFEDFKGRAFLKKKEKLRFIKGFNEYLNEKVNLYKKYKNTDVVRRRTLIKIEVSKIGMFVRGEKGI